MAAKPFLRKTKQNNLKPLRVLTADPKNEILGPSRSPYALKCYEERSLSNSFKMIVEGAFLRRTNTCLGFTSRVRARASSSTFVSKSLRPGIKNRIVIVISIFCAL